MKRVAIYVRVSTESQAEEDKYSIPLQKEACINYCKCSSRRNCIGRNEGRLQEEV